jgi:hypothetical protein
MSDKKNKKPKSDKAKQQKSPPRNPAAPDAKETNVAEKASSKSAEKSTSKAESTKSAEKKIPASDAPATKDQDTTSKDTSSSEKKKRKKKKDKELKPEDLPNRAPVVDPFGEPLTLEQERERVEIKASTIPKGGNGVFAKFDFAKDDVICEFVGKRCTRDEAYNQMQYAIEFTNDDGETVLIDGWGYDNAAGIANDALGRTRLPRARNNARFWHYGNRMFLCAKRNIRKAEEIFVQYGHEYWQMTKEDYHKINNTDQIIELKLDTCH